MADRETEGQTTARGLPAADATKGAKGKKPDIFIRDSTYPDPEVPFRVRTGRVDALKDDCVFVLDTNTLLAPYGVGTRALKEIRRVLSLVTAQQRLCIPAQVAREFADNRASRLTEIYADVQRKRDRPKLPWSPLLESMPSYKAVSDAEAKVEAAWRKYSSALDEMLTQMQAWKWDDPVSSAYSDIFLGKKVVTSIEYNVEEVRSELARRFEHGIPPGYKDKGKDDEGIGDLLIWKTILHVGKSRQSHVVFVSGEGKPDWWYRSAGSPLYPRFELLAEFDAASGGKSFNIVRFAEFLELFGVPQEAVEQVRKEEERPKRLPTASADSGLEPSMIAATNAVGAWLMTWPNVSRVDANARFPDFEATYPDGSVSGVEVKVLANRTLPRIIDSVARQTLHWLSGDYRRRRVVVVTVARDSAQASQIRIPKHLPPEIEVVIGWLSDGKFVADQPDV